MINIHKRKYIALRKDKNARKTQRAKEISFDLAHKLVVKEILYKKLFLHTHTRSLATTKTDRNDKVIFCFCVVF